MNHVAVQSRLAKLRLLGVRFDTTSFTPTQRAFHGRPPELADTLLRGIRVRITDRDLAAPYRIGIALLWAVHAEHRDRLVWRREVLDRLTATPRLLAQLEAGATPAAIADSWRAELRAHLRRRAPYLLYR
jgi:uncharacterized protein YbbC (DUF1343 family)